MKIRVNERCFNKAAQGTVRPGGTSGAEVHPLRAVELRRDRQRGRGRLPIDLCGASLYGSPRANLKGSRHKVRGTTSRGSTGCRAPSVGA